MWQETVTINHWEFPLPQIKYIWHANARKLSFGKIIIVYQMSLLRIWFCAWAFLFIIWRQSSQRWVCQRFWWRSIPNSIGEINDKTCNIIDCTVEQQGMHMIWGIKGEPAGMKAVMENYLLYCTYIVYISLKGWRCQ